MRESERESTNHGQFGLSEGGVDGLSEARNEVRCTRFKLLPGDFGAEVRIVDQAFNLSTQERVSEKQGAKEKKRKQDND